MTRDQVVDKIKLRMGNWNNTAANDIIIGELDFVITQVLEAEAELPWFLQKETSGLATVIDQDYVVLPSDFLLPFDEDGLWLTKADGDKVRLVREDWDVVKAQVEGSGQPEYYDYVGADNVYFRKTPDAVYALEMFYYSRATSLAGVYGDSANVENSWLKYAAELVLGEAGLAVAGQYLQSEKMMASFAAQAQRGRVTLMAKTVHMREVAKDRVMEG